MESKSRGILFYSDGFKTIPELLVALYSLKKYNPTINTHIVLGLRTPTEFVNSIDSSNLSYTYNHTYPYPRVATHNRKTFIWCQKPFVIGQSPFDITLYYDCDHVFLKHIPNSIWQQVENYGLTTGIVSGLMMPSRRNFMVWRDAWNMRHGKELFSKSVYPTFSRVNGGCLGYCKSKDTPLLLWIDTMRWIFECSGISNKRLFTAGDEPALALTMNYYKQGWLGDAISQNYHPYEIVDSFPSDTISVHLSRSAYNAHDIRKQCWNRELQEAHHFNFLGCQTWLNKYRTL